jgi:hypothetical protein
MKTQDTSNESQEDIEVVEGDKRLSTREIMRELVSMGINPSEAMQNDTFCRCLENYRLKKGDVNRITTESLLYKAEEIFYDAEAIEDTTGY